MTTRGFKDEEARMTANLIADVLDSPRDAANIHRLSNRAGPLYAIAQDVGRGDLLPTAYRGFRSHHHQRAITRRAFHPRWTRTFETNCF